MKTKNVYLSLVIVVLSYSLPRAQPITIEAAAHTRHALPALISVTFTINAAVWNISCSDNIQRPEQYTIIDSTANRTFVPDKIEYDTSLIVMKKTKIKPTAHLYSLTGFAPDHHYKIEWKYRDTTYATIKPIVFEDCSAAPTSHLDVKPVLETKTVAVDFDFSNSMYNDKDLLITWRAKGYLDFSNLDSVSNAEFNVACQYPISELRPHPFFIGKIGGDLNGRFTAADIKATAGVSILDQYVLPPILQFLQKNIFQASMPVPPPVLAVFGEAALPWTRAQGIGDAVIWRLAGEIDMNVPVGNGNYLNVYARGWVVTNTQTPSFVEFSYKKEVTRDISVVLKWLNGSLPPLFQKGSNIMAGVSVLFPGFAQ
ncbi:MAG: hypothetical protein ABR936_15435 [Bacteroidota bacterium]|jgi:hypothetical protein